MILAAMIMALVLAAGSDLSATATQRSDQSLLSVTTHHRYRCAKLPHGIALHCIDCPKDTQSVGDLTIGDCDNCGCEEAPPGPQAKPLGTSNLCFNSGGNVVPCSARDAIERIPPEGEPYAEIISPSTANIHCSPGYHAVIKEHSDNFGVTCEPKPKHR